MRPGRLRPASPSPPAGRSAGRCRARPDRRRGPTRRSASLQWIGTNSEPRCWPAEATTLSTHAPCAVETRAKPLWVRPCILASSGWTSTNGSGRCAPSRGLGPMRVMLCHWSRSRPVLRRNGNSALVGSRRMGGSGATKRALRSGVKKPPPENNRAGSTVSFAAQRPLHRLERLVVLVANGGERADVERARAVILERRERGVLAKDVGGIAIREGRSKTPCAAPPRQPSTSPAWPRPATARTAAGARCGAPSW